MAIKTRINRSKGVEQVDGASGLDVESNSNNVGFSPFALPTTAVGTAFTVTTPGYYQVSGSTFATGTIPAADSMPGANLLFLMTNGNTLFLTGSRRSANNVDGVFVASGLTSSSFNRNSGDGLRVGASGSVMLCSDGRYWIPVVSSGSLTLVA